MKQFATWPLIFSLPLLLGISSCEKPDAFICSFIVKSPIENSYSFCVNSKTKEEKEVPLKDMAKYVTMDLPSYNTYRDFYKKQCEGNNVKSYTQTDHK